MWSGASGSITMTVILYTDYFRVRLLNGTQGRFNCKEVKMPWKPGTLEVAAAGLRRSAADGYFEPFVWNGGIETNKDGGCAIYGCGWGQVAWIIAVFMGGTAQARAMLPPGAEQEQVNAVLLEAGLTVEEIELMEPEPTWTYFDQRLYSAFNTRYHDPENFIKVSGELAEFFIQVLEVVPKEISAPMMPESLQFRGWLSKITTSIFKYKKDEVISA